MTIWCETCDLDVAHEDLVPMDEYDDGDGRADGNLPTQHCPVCDAPLRVGSHANEEAVGFCWTEVTA